MLNNNSAFVGVTCTWLMTMHDMNNIKYYWALKEVALCMFKHASLVMCLQVTDWAKIIITENEVFVYNKVKTVFVLIGNLQP